MIEYKSYILSKQADEGYNKRKPMRNTVKKQLLDILQSMAKVHDEINKKIKKGTMEGVGSLLIECQGAAIQIGELIEQAEGEGTKTVRILEQYCEELYLLSLDDANNQSRKVQCKNLQNYLIQTKESIRNDLKTQYEVAFFPYKASMWDSLESIWKEAEADSEVETYVVPIPYYELNPDRSFGEMHYEGNLYPNYVQIVPWEQYCVEERRPDIVFIHNPYDNSNYVTSVHPDFYSSKLKKFTDMLVYIPYFVGPHDVKEEFCVLPAVIHANKVVLQSEVVKNTYIRCLDKFIKENNYEKIIVGWKEKFLALGSPKFDKVLSTREEDCNIPEEWQKLVNDRNEQNKRIIFYNTSIAALLEEDEKMMDKIEFVLEFFKNQEDVLLLWRPHPLSLTTLFAMRPELFSRYNGIVEKYKSEKWGIYDDSADINRAIALSDAYYGDWSSLVPLYQITGKPIMIQHVNIMDGE